MYDICFSLFDLLHSVWQEGFYWKIFSGWEHIGNLSWLNTSYISPIALCVSKTPTIDTWNTTIWNTEKHRYLLLKHFASHEMTTSSDLSPVILKDILDFSSFKITSTLLGVCLIIFTIELFGLNDVRSNEDKYCLI